MKNFKLVLLCGMLILGITACNSADEKKGSDTEPSTNSFTEDGGKAAEDVLNQLKNGGIDIDYFINYDNTNDPNLIRKYIGKINFNDKSLMTDYDPKEPVCGSIEVFKSNDEAKERADTLIQNKDQDNYGNQILLNNVLVRLSKKYEKEDIDKFASILNNDVYNYRDDNKKNMDSEETPNSWSDIYKGMSKNALAAKFKEAGYEEFADGDVYKYTWGPNLEYSMRFDLESKFVDFNIAGELTSVYYWNEDKGAIGTCKYDYSKMDAYNSTTCTNEEITELQALKEGIEKTLNEIGLSIRDLNKE